MTVKPDPRVVFVRALLGFAAEHHLRWPKEVTLYLRGEGGWLDENEAVLTMPTERALEWIEALGSERYLGGGGVWSGYTSLAGFNVSVRGFARAAQ